LALPAGLPARRAAVPARTTAAVSAAGSAAESERVLCARYAAVQVDRRLQANLALAASIRSC